MTHRPYDDYTLEGQRALGEAIAHWRDVEKPHWNPVVTEGMSMLDVAREREEKWSLDRMAAIINREFALTGENRVDRNVLHRLENPPIKREAPPTRLVELVANLQIMLNPATNQPFSDEDLRAIAKSLLDWRTGTPLSDKRSSRV